MATTRENLKKVDEAIENLQKTIVPVAHEAFKGIGSVVQMVDSNVDRIAKAAVTFGRAQADLTASTAPNESTIVKKRSTKRKAK